MSVDATYTKKKMDMLWIDDLMDNGNNNNDVYDYGNLFGWYKNCECNKLIESSYSNDDLQKLLDSFDDISKYRISKYFTQLRLGRNISISKNTRFEEEIKSSPNDYFFMCASLNEFGDEVLIKLTKCEYEGIINEINEINEINLLFDLKTFNDYYYGPSV